MSFTVLGYENYLKAETVVRHTTSSQPTLLNENTITLFTASQLISKLLLFIRILYTRSNCVRTSPQPNTHDLICIMNISAASHVHVQY